MTRLAWLRTPSHKHARFASPYLEAAVIGVIVLITDSADIFVIALTLCDEQSDELEEYVARSSRPTRSHIILWNIADVAGSAVTVDIVSYDPIARTVLFRVFLAGVTALCTVAAAIVARDIALLVESSEVIGVKGP